MHFIGLDVHKKTIAYCAKTAAGTIVDEGTIQALRPELEAWAAARPSCPIQDEPEGEGDSNTR